jgi:D-sedoheptulose 7-phosphate isomerase
LENILNSLIRHQIWESQQVKMDILRDDSLMTVIQEVSEACVEVYRSGHKTLLAGNGGSAADAQHIAAELVGRFYFDRPSLPSIALTTDSSMLTAISNDYGYEQVFRRQIQAHGSKGDMFIGISTSGKSPNIVEAVKLCRQIGVISVGLTGQGGGDLAELCDYCIAIPSDNTPRIQESHILVGHIICSVVEEVLFGNLLSQPLEAHLMYE